MGKPRLARLAAAVAVVLGAGCGSQGPDASAVGTEARGLTVDTVYTVVGVQSGRCMNIAGSSTADLAAVELRDCSGGTGQQFRLEAAASGYYTLRAVGSGKCLDVRGASTSAGAGIIQYTCHGGTNQQWSTTDLGNGAVRIAARSSGMVLDANGARTANGTTIIQWPSTGGTNQQWKLTAAGGEVTSYALTIATSGSGTTSPAAGTYTYASGTSVAVTATPASGYTFTGWSGAATGTANPVTIAMDGDKTLTANFAGSGPVTVFVHPGLLHTTADLERMKSKVASAAEPYVTGWERLRKDPITSLDYTPKPSAVVRRIPDDGSYWTLVKDAIAAHAHAIAWVITGDPAHAKKSAEILNAWSSMLTSIPSDGDPVLSAGLSGYQLAVTAEVLRATYPGWAAEDQARLKALLLNVFYPPNHNFLIYHEPDGLAHGSTGVNLHFFASWDALALTTVGAIGVFADDRSKYQEAVDYFKNGTGNGAIMRAVFDGETGQLQESGRDPEHAQLGIGLLATFCEIAWNQGDDLYGYADNRLLRGFEYTASYLLGNDVPFKTYTDPFRTYTKVSSEFTAEQIASSRAHPRPIYEMVWNHYINRRGVPAPFTRQIAEKIRPEGYNADHVGFGTILFTR